MASCSCDYVDYPILENSCGSAAVGFMSLLQTLIHVQCTIADPCNRVISVEEPLSEYDFIVVGAGVAGSVVASRLSEIEDWTVLLVEAGTQEPSTAQVPGFVTKVMGTQYDWKYTTEPQGLMCGWNGGTCGWPRGKVLGGTGVFNYMMYVRGHPKDYDGFLEAGNTGWGYDDVLPHFLKSEDNGNPDLVDPGYHSVGGYLPVEQFPYHPPITQSVLDAGKELGYETVDINGKNSTGFTINQVMAKHGVRFSPARSFLRPANNRTNLHVITDSLATRILIDPDTKVATGIEYLRNGQTATVNARKEIIVSGGAINTPQLLMLSGIGPRDHLEELGIDVIQDLPVGNNLHDSVAFFLGFSTNESDHRVLTVDTATEYLESQSGPLASTGLSQLNAMISSKYAEKDYPDIQLKFGGYMADCTNTGSPDECTSGSPPDCGRRQYSIGATTLHTESKGTLRLRSTDPLDQPVMDPKYLSEQIDVDTLVEGAKFIVELINTEALKPWDAQMNTYPVGGCEDFEFGSDEYWECAARRRAGPDNHMSGTAKMGPEGDPEAVVNPQLQVHGLSNLRVADASILPHVTSGNPAAAIIMVGEKVSDMIKETWQQQ